MSRCSGRSSGGLTLSTPFLMRIRDVFRFKDGRTVLVGEVEGEDNLIPTDLCELAVDGEVRGRFRIEGEMIECGAGADGPGRLRSISTRRLGGLESSDLGEREWSIRPGPRREQRMHRHLIGVDSPPPDYVADPLTLGPVLPEGWDGDAWVEPGGRGYFLRAWHKPTARVAYGRGPTYEAARRVLLDDVRSGARRAEVTDSGVGMA